MAGTLQAQTLSLPKAVLDSIQLRADYADVIYYPPATATLSMEGPNVKFLNQFLGKPLPNPPAAKADGFVMWLIQGKEFLKGDFYLQTKPPYWLFEWEGKKISHEMTESGKTFLQQYFK